MMCCELTQELELTPAAIEALARYRALRQRGWDWGDDRIDMFRWMRFSAFGPVFERFAEIGDWPASVRATIGDDVPAGIVVVEIDATGDLRVRTGPARPIIAGCTTGIDVVVDSGLDVTVTASIGDRAVTVPAAGVAIDTLDVAGVDRTVRVSVGERAVAIDDAVEAVPAARLQLSSAQCARWSVLDATGGAWFPDDVLRKWDVHHRPFFHGHDVSVAVPATPLRVACTRGVEFDVREVEVEPNAGQTTVVDLTPSRLFDPTTAGWYGGDLHIHMNYSGDLVCSPEDAARMQLGEGLHLANLVSGDCQTSLVYDREMLEGSVGVDLPWSGSDTVARMGVEYRNDLLGHVHALGPSAPPSRYYSGHERSDHPYDWPPNADVCREFRRLDATVGYPIRRSRRSRTTGPSSSSSPYRAQSRRVSWWRTRRWGWSTRSMSSLLSTTRAPRSSTTDYCHAGCGSRRPPGPMCSCPSHTARTSPRTRRAGAVCTPTLATRGCRSPRSRTRSAQDARS
jgi:hypothetical protein